MGKAVGVVHGGGLLLMFFMCLGFSLSQAVNGCIGARSCCRFWSQPMELNKCCKPYGCCPLCEEISRGCCYNGKMYMWGDVVAQFPDLCFKLVCAAQVSTVRPFLNAVIVPVSMPSLACKEREKCNKCTKCSCVDATGLVQTEGVPWYSDECHKCFCRAGEVVCEKDVRCPVQPHRSCVAVPGPCCPAWNCSVRLERMEEVITGCTDSVGGYHKLGEEWTTEDPCIIFTCTKGLIEEKSVNCELMAPPYPGCSEYTPRGECCLKWNCSGCVDETGKLHTLYKVWKSDSCTTNYCTRSGIQTTRETCELGPAPHPSCLKIITPEECCPKWNCSGCTDPAGGYHELGQEWTKSDPCVVFKCTEGVINENPVNCDKLALPRPGCSEYTPVGECCPKWNCSGCIDGNGKLHPLYEMWKTDACTTHYCTRTGIQTTQETCDLEPAPHPNCRKIVPPRVCCPEWICRGCRDATGKFHDLGDKWSIGDPCVVLVCTEKGIVTERVQCKETLPPNADCTLYKPLGDCCSKWNCSGCVDLNGNYHPLYQLWKTDNCTTYICKRDGIKASKENCSAEPAPHPSCQSVTSAGDCCPQWKCRGCIDLNGKFHGLGEKINTDDPCLVSVCTERGITMEHMHCSDTLPPNTGCYKYQPIGECCSKWNCSGCVDSSGNVHPFHEVWKTDSCTTHVCLKDGIKTAKENCSLGPAPDKSCQTFTPPGDCCPEWKCSVCEDEIGNVHPLYKVWKTDPCTTHSCRSDGIKTAKEICSLGPAPGTSCQTFTPPGGCCPEWKCRGCFDDGNFRELGRHWKTGPCTVMVCTERGIVEEHVACGHSQQPHPGCYKYTPLGECCPKWNCSVCVDDDGNFHPLYQTWKTDPCTTQTCTNNGIQSTKQICKLEPAPDHNCVKYVSTGDCCPVWNCSGCIDLSGQYHELHKRWQAGDCVSHECTSEGILTSVIECIPKPHPNCVELKPPLKCCPIWRCGPDCRLVKCGRPPGTDCMATRPTLACCDVWNCSGCHDELGLYHPLSSEWKTGPCKTSLCTKDGIRVTEIFCGRTVRPYSNCIEYTPDDECCSKWNCSCVDGHGTPHGEGESWKDPKDPCQYCSCTGGQMTCGVLDCDSPPPWPCDPPKLPGQCCPNICAPPVINACRDKEGNNRREGESWTDSEDPCLNCTCVKGKGRCVKVQCAAAPDWPCDPPKLPGQCCPHYCPRPMNTRTTSAVELDSCVDNYGTRHPLGEVWLDQSNSCLQYWCGRLGFIQSFKRC